MKKAKEFRDQTVEELQSAYTDYQKELFSLVNEKKLSKKLEKPHLLRTNRKNIARLLTVINEKKKA
jgi:large subunit ribosomal protein L29